MTERTRWAHCLWAVGMGLAVSVGVQAQAGANAGDAAQDDKAAISGPPMPIDPSVVTISITPARGADRKLDYTTLLAYGPWDDRNYALTAADLKLLSPNEHEAQVPIPAFYRVEMRRANPNLPTSGPAQYPRSALNGFLAKHGGYQVNGTVFTRIRAIGDNRFEILDGSLEPPNASGILPNFIGGEARITTPAGAAESAISVNPLNNNLVIAGSNGPGSGQKMWYSSNGGVSWSGPVSLANTCCDPAVGWSPDGTVGYAAALSTVVGGGTNVLFYRSTNNGQSWTLSKQLNNANASDKEYFHVDHQAGSPYLGRIYLAWHDSNVQKFAYSSDGGLNFSAIQTLDSASRGIGSDLTSDAAGNVYFFFPTTSGGSNAKQIRMLKSTNGGASFGTGVTVSATNADFDFPIPAMETRRAFIYVSADSDRSGGTYNGSVYVAWTDTSTTENNNTASANHAVVKVAYSRNGGSSWTVANAHPSADINTIDRFNQWLSVDSSGRVFVMYYDTRNSSGRTGTDIYYVVSSDGAQTWSAPTRLSSVTSRNITDSFEWGDYNGMDAMMQNLIAIYTDNRDESGGTAQSVDVYAVGGFGGAPANVPPVANFSFGTSGLTANFTDSSSDSDGSIASRSWNFGDGGTSTATNPSRTYAAAGTYNVQLTVTDNGGATHSVTKAVTVSSAANVAPVANFSFTTSGLTASFTDSSTDSDGSIASRSWNFGDSTTSTATSPTKTYAAAGTYTVQLTVTDNGGATNSTTRSVTVTAPPSNALANGVPRTGLAGAAGSTTFYTVEIPAGASNLSIATSGGTGDADLYVRFGSQPTTSTYDCRPYLGGNAETCSFATPQVGTYHVMLRGYSAYTGVTLTASWSTTTPGSLFQNTTDFAIGDNTTIESPIVVSGRSGNAPTNLQVAVRILHTYKGDLKVDLVAPDGSVYVLHNRTGGGTDNIIQTFTVNASSEVANGTWKLRVNDNANGDTGTLDQWSLQF